MPGGATAHIYIPTLTEQLRETPRRIYNDQNESGGGREQRRGGSRGGAGAGEGQGTCS